MGRLTIRTDEGVKLLLPGLQLPYTTEETAAHYMTVLIDAINKLATYEDKEEELSNEEDDKFEAILRDNPALRHI